jgi:hypothetical protein
VSGKRFTPVRPASADYPLRKVVKRMPPLDWDALTTVEELECGHLFVAYPAMGTRPRVERRRCRACYEFGMARVERIGP